MKIFKLVTFIPCCMLIRDSWLFGTLEYIHKDYCDYTFVILVTLALLNLLQISWCPQKYIIWLGSSLPFSFIISESSVNTHSRSSESKNYKNLSRKNFFWHVIWMSWMLQTMFKSLCKYPYLDLSYVPFLILLNSLSYTMMS